MGSLVKIKQDSRTRKEYPSKMNIWYADTALTTGDHSLSIIPDSQIDDNPVTQL